MEMSPAKNSATISQTKRRQPSVTGPRKGENEEGYEMKKRNRQIGPSLEDFLKEEGVLEETRAVALKETLAWQVQEAMEKDKISKAEMARRSYRP
jgi:hypothetical protein